MNPMIYKNTLTAIRLIFTLILVLVTTSLFAQDPGFFLDDWQERSAVFPSHEMTEKPWKAATVNVKVEMDSVVNKIPHLIFGNNAVTYGKALIENARAISDLTNLKPNVLRWPGGSLSDHYFWNASPSSKPGDVPEDFNVWYGMDSNWAMSLDEYYDLLEETGSTGIICVNYGYARYGLSADPVAAAAHMAAEWVRYDKGRTRYWEIGNENYGSWEAGYEIDQSVNQDGQPKRISGKLYGEHCRVYIDSMRIAAAEVGNDIKIGVVAYDSEESWDALSSVWNEEMMPEVGHMADFIVVHSYFTPYAENSSVSTILNSHHVPGDMMDVIVADMAEAGQEMIPVAMTEWNIFAVGSKQQVSYIAGMHAALVLGEYVINDYGMASRWDLLNNWAEGDDHGLFSTGGEPGVDPLNPRPAFFYMFYWQKYLGDRMVASSVEANNDVISYASSFSSGDCGMVLINKGKTEQIVAVEIDSMEVGKRYYTHTLTGGSDNGDFSRKVYLNGYGTDEEGGGPDEYESIKALASETKGGIRVELPPLGTVYLLVEKMELAYASSKVEKDPQVVDVTFTREVDSVGTPSGFIIAANGTDTLDIDTVQIDPIHTRVLHIHLEQPVLNTDVVTISYDGMNVRAMDGEMLKAFSGETADNLLPGSAPVVKKAYTNEAGTEVHLSFLKDMQLQGATQANFNLHALADQDSTLSLSGVIIDTADAKKIIISSADPLFAEHQLFISYAGAEIISSDGGILAYVDSMEVENNAPGFPPEVLLAKVNPLGSGVEVTFSKNMLDLSALAEAFSITVDGQTRAITEITSEENGASIYIEGSLFAEEEVELSYSGTAAISEDRGVLAIFTDLAVTNDLIPPYVFEIPGVIDAENYMYNFGIECEACGDAEGGQNLCGIDPGDYVDFRIHVTRTGEYKCIIRTAAMKSTGYIRIQTPFLETVDRKWVKIPLTGGWQTWSSVPTSFSLEEGIQTIRLYAQTDGYNINWLSLEPDTATHVEDVQVEEISIYPNPAAGHITIKSGSKGISGISIVDITGSEVLRREYDTPFFSKTLDLDLPAGLYLVKVRTGSSARVSRLIIR